MAKRGPEKRTQVRIRMEMTRQNKTVETRPKRQGQDRTGTGQDRTGQDQTRPHSSRSMY